MLYGRVLRPPASTRSWSRSMRRRPRGQTRVTVVHDGDFVGRRGARLSSTLSKAIGAIRAAVEGRAAAVGRRAVRVSEEHEPRGRARRPTRQARSSRVWRSADHKLDATYTVAYIAHTPLEPRAAVAEWNDGKLTVWTGTQRPFGVRERTGRGVRHSRRSRARDRAGHRLRLRRQAHRRSAPSKRRAWPRRPASRSSWSGRAKKSSPGPTSGRPA